MAELSDTQLSASEAKEKKKKKKKKKRELREGRLSEEAALWSPDRSFVFSGRDNEPGEAGRNKENEQRGASDSELAASCVSMESEVTTDAGTGIVTHKKKKKKKKRAPIELDDTELRVHTAQVKISASPRTDIQGNVDVWREGTPVKKKKREKGLFTEQTEASSPNSSRQARIGSGGLEDTETELFTSLPLSQTQRSSPRGGSDRDTSGEPDSAHREKVSRRKRKGSRAKESDTTDSLAAEEGVDLANGVTQQPGSSPKQSALVGSKGSAYSPTPVRNAEKELSPPGRRPSRARSENLDSSEVCRLDLDTAMQELETFIPHVRTLSAAHVKQLARRDLTRFRNFRQEGVAVKFGKFSQKEDKQLIANVRAFLETNGIDTAEKLFFPDRFPEEKQAIRNLKVKHLFGVTIAEGIPRPWRLVYYRARKIFDPQNSNRLYSRKEVKKLRKYHAIYGNNWKKISELMDRSSHSVALKYAQIKSKPNSGHWSREEVKQLICAVGETISSKVRGLGSALEEGDAEKALSLMRENLYKGISWTKVEDKVGTRHWRQCKHKWMSIVTKRMSRGQCVSHGPENVQAKINLIERMYELNVEDASEIDWEELSSALGNVPPYYAQRRFYKLKIQHVPAWNTKRFPEIIDHLYEVTLPRFKDQLLKRKQARRPATPNPSQAGKSSQKRTYNFSDIFCVSDSDLSGEDDGNEVKTLASHEVDSGSRKDSGSL